MWRSGRADDSEPTARCGDREALVIGHEPLQVRTQLLSAREVDRVERSKTGRRQQPGSVGDAIIDPQQVHPREDLPALPDRVRTNGKERADDLRPSEGA